MDALQEALIEAKIVRASLKCFDLSKKKIIKEAYLLLTPLETRRKQKLEENNKTELEFLGDLEINPSLSCHL